MSNESKREEQRRFRRIQFEADAMLFSSSEAWPTRLEDISLAGALIAEPDGWTGELGSSGRLELHLGGGVVIGMAVTVASRREGHLGLRCERIDVQSFTHLKRIVALNLGETELLNRELEALG